MGADFRSRGFSYNILSKKMTMKKYYEPNNDVLLINENIRYISSNMKCLEYSVNDKGKIDSINFHTECNNISNYILYNFNDIVSLNIKSIFDESYKAYTVGYRLTDTYISGMSIYYYPTVWKKERFGICGITDNIKICHQISLFLTAIKATDKCRNKMKQLTPAIKKFKGCCITSDYNNIISYKLYFKINICDIKSFFEKNIDINKLEDNYGDTVLIAVRFDEGEISGYNFYYLN